MLLFSLGVGKLKLLAVLDYLLLPCKLLLLQLEFRIWETGDALCLLPSLESQRSNGLALWHGGGDVVRNLVPVLRFHSRAVLSIVTTAQSRCCLLRVSVMTRA